MKKVYKYPQKYSYKGQEKSLSEWAKELGITYSALWHRMYYDKNTLIKELDGLGLKNKLNNSSEERDICSYFACASKLTMAESLCGSRCINHMNKTKYK